MVPWLGAWRRRRPGTAPDRGFHRLEEGEKNRIVLGRRLSLGRVTAAGLALLTVSWRVAILGSRHDPR
jgi:hypothetical protein